MKSEIAGAINLKHHPVAVILSDEKPDQALQFKPGKWGCVMFMFANAARGKTAAFDAQTYGCWGGGVGLGFGNAYQAFPGGVDCFAHFLSSGNDQWAVGLTFAMPWQLFQEMEAQVDGSFLQRPTWLSLISSRKEKP